MSKERNGEEELEIGENTIVEVPDEKLLSTNERRKRIAYFLAMISIIPTITVIILKTITEGIFGFLSSGIETDGFSFGGTTFIAWMIIWIVIAAIEIKIAIKETAGIVFVESSTQAMIEMFGGYIFTAKYKAKGKITLTERIFCFYWPFEKCRKPLPSLEPLPDEKPKEPLAPELMSLKTGMIDTEKQEVITKDHVLTNLDAFVYGHIYKGQKAVFGIDDLYAAIKILSIATMRLASGDIPLDELIASEGKDKIRNEIIDALQKPTDEWGFKVTEVRIEIVDPSKEVKEAMQKATIAERERKATIINADAERQQKILLAEGGKKEKQLLAEGEKTEIMKTREGLAATGSEKENEQIDVSKISPKDVITYKYVDETLPKIADGQATKIIVPEGGSSELAKLVTQVAEFAGDTTGARKPAEKAKVQGKEESEEEEMEETEEKEE